MTAIPDILIPLIFTFGMKRWSDTFLMIIPPNTSFVVREESPPGKAILNYFITYGTPRIYNPETGELGDPIISTDVGFYRMSGQVKWHMIPFMESIYKYGYGDATITGENLYECTVMVYNYTPYYVAIGLTTYLIEFPMEYRRLVLKYFRGIVNFFIKQAEEIEREYTSMAGKVGGE